MTTATVRVAVPSPLRRGFDYLLPQDMPAPSPGCRVRVSFGAREVIGVVLPARPEPGALPGAKLKPLLAVLDDAPVIGDALLRLCLWAADYYQHPVGEVLAAALPVLLRQGETARHRHPKGWQLTAGGRGAPPLTRAPRQAEAMRLLADAPGPLPAELLASLGVERASLAALHKRGYAEEVEMVAGAVAPGALLAEVALAPTADQTAALEAVRAQRGFGVFVLEGVTGSGKTEVYLQLAADALARGEQVLVLVPEIGLTPQTVHRFRARFNRPVVVLHSQLGDRERLDSWLDAAAGSAAIVLGTRSAVFTPLARPGLIIIDEEHDPSFKQQDGFRYHARDLAILRARDAGIPVLLGSATPSLETLHNALAGKYRLLPLPRRAGAARPPALRVVDIRRAPVQEGLSVPLLTAMRETLARDEQVLLFLNRRGYAPVLVCHDCGWTADCRRCDARYTLHLEPRHLHCHHCGSESSIPRRCGACGSTDLVAAGLGTERVEETLEKLFRGTRILRIDSDSTRRRQALPAAFEAIHAGGPLVLVGTQMIAKGHHFPHVTLVGVVDADGGLLSADFRAGERLAQTLVQVAGRAGRAEKPGEVIIQTRVPDHPLLRHLVHEGYDSWARAALTDRQQAELPPFSHLCLLRAEATRENTALDFLENAKAMAAGLLGTRDGEVLLMGPAPAPMARRGGRWRAQLLLQADGRAPLHAFLARFVPALEADPASRRVRWSIDVDPVDLT